MNCGRFERGLNSALVGDAHEETMRALAEHARACIRCRPKWQQAARELAALQAPAPLDAEAIARARERLRERFSREHVPPVRFGAMKTPVGTIFVGASDRGVCDVAFNLKDTDAYRARLKYRAPEVARDDQAVKPALEELAAYFAGELRTFSVPIDLHGVTSFTTRVLEKTLSVPFGGLTTYGDLAARIGSPRGARAVGGALGRNPIPIIIPCHRVVQGGGSLGGYTGGLNIKRALLKIEGHGLF